MANRRGSLWLFKEEPTHYSYDELVKDGKTTWSGVKNNLALKHLRSVKRGDRIFFYHSGKEKQIVGIMEALGDAYSTSREPIETSKDVEVIVAPLEKLERPVTLKSIKKDARFSSFPLVRISRLSAMPVESKIWSAILDMSRS